MRAERLLQPLGTEANFHAHVSPPSTEGSEKTAELRIQGLLLIHALAKRMPHWLRDKRQC